LRKSNPITGADRNNLRGFALRLEAVGYIYRLLLSSNIMCLFQF
jgi:hypothetical protein